MEYRVVWTDRAMGQVTEIGDYIAEDSPKAALTMVERLFDEVEVLSGFPELGSIVEELKDPRIRKLLVPPYMVAYRIQEEFSLVEILAVRHGRRDRIERDDL